MSDTKECTWCKQTIIGKRTNVKRGDAYMFYHQHCLTKYNNAIKAVEALLQQK